VAEGMVKRVWYVSTDSVIHMGGSDKWSTAGVRARASPISHIYK